MRRPEFDPEVAAAADRLNALALPVARARLAELGEERSGAFAFYRERIEAGDLFAVYERRLAAAIAAAPDMPGTIHEVGGGWGTLSWLLAALGRDVVCIEHDPLRLAGAEALLAAIGADWPELAARVRLTPDSFPSRRLQPENAVLVASNFIHTADPERFNAVLGALARYRHAVVDVDRFVRQAVSEADRRDLLGRFERAGIGAEPFLDLAHSGRYYRLAGSRQAEARREPEGIAVAYRDVLSRREVDRIVYFHSDHFEPWQAGPDLNQRDRRARNIDRVRQYADRMGALHYARRLGLFYLPELATGLEDGGKSLLRVEGDVLGIQARPPEHDAEVRAGFAGLDPRTDFDFQVHLHHERLTWNRLSAARAGAAEAFATNDVELNRRRFDLGLAEVLRRVRNDTGRALDEWFFVHGLWALNASDLDVCSITDEIARLKAAGCLGDFTMPAGRPQCDPPFDVPALVRPVDAPKGYALGEADPQPAHLVDPADRFLIWSSRTSHADASLDFESDEVRANFANVGPWGERLLVNGFQRGSTLYVKTHAHSMFPFYFDPRSGGTAGRFPHEHDAIKRLIDAFEEAAAAIGGRVDYLGPSEVYREVVRPLDPGERAVTGYAETGLTFPRSAIEQAEAAAFAVLSDRLERMGAEEGGLQAHYQMLVERGRIVQPVEIEIANLVHRLIPAGLPLVHGRSAAGVLPLALALGGRQVTSFEPNPRRNAAQRAIFDRLVADVPDLAARYDLREARVTTEPAARFAGSAVLFTEFSSALSDDGIDRLLGDLQSAEIVLLDALRFGARRREEDAAAFVDRLRARDGTAARLVLDLGDAGQFYLIDNRGMAQPRRSLRDRLRAAIGVGR